MIDPHGLREEILPAVISGVLESILGFPVSGATKLEAGLAPRGIYYLTTRMVWNPQIPVVPGRSAHCSSGCQPGGIWLERRLRVTAGIDAVALAPLLHHAVEHDPVGRKTAFGNGFLPVWQPMPVERRNETTNSWSPGIRTATDGSLPRGGSASTRIRSRSRRLVRRRWSAASPHPGGAAWRCDSRR